MMKNSPNQNLSPTQTSYSHERDSPLGLVIACSIIATWVLSLVILLNFNTDNINILLIAIAILWQTFLYTGLFITAHDAMHGVVFAKNLRINNFIGSLAVILYALFDYKKLRKRHWLHHQHPASELDPDYHNGKHTNFFSWYLYFMFRYWSWLRLAGLISAYHIMNRVFHVSESNLVMFWAVPSLLSSVQLFYFGTFLPHKEPLSGYKNSDRVTSIYLPKFWSFITCYHFLYHQEHHEYNYVPWWQLPRVAIHQGKA